MFGSRLNSKGATSLFQKGPFACQGMERDQHLRVGAVLIRGHSGFEFRTLRLEPFPRGRLVFTRIGIFQCWGEAPIGPHPPVAYRVSKLERPQCNCPALGPFWFGREPVTKPPAFASTISLVAGRGSNGALAEILSTNPIQPVSRLGAWSVDAASYVRAYRRSARARLSWFSVCNDFATH